MRRATSARAKNRGMVRPDGADTSDVAEVTVPGCTDLAGASPVRVTPSGPGSRPPTRSEISGVEARRQRPRSRREQGSGPQPSEVNVAASTDLQPKGVWEGRACHVKAKAIPSTLATGRGVEGLPGVETAARSHRLVRNRRGPRWRPVSGKDVRISARRESVRRQQGVRGGRSTDERVDNTREGRAPTSVEPKEQVSARAWS